MDIEYVIYTIGLIFITICVSVISLIVWVLVTVGELIGKAVDRIYDKGRSNQDY